MKRRYCFVLIFILVVALGGCGAGIRMNGQSNSNATAPDTAPEATTLNVVIEGRIVQP